MWPKIRNALLQLRRDAIAGKCIRMNSKRKPKQQPEQEQKPNQNQCHSDYDDDESPHNSDLCK